MRRTTNVIALLLIAAVLPKTQVNRAAHYPVSLPQDDIPEIRREDHLFVKNLYFRLDSLLSREREKYDLPYTAIRIKEYQIKEQMDQTKEKREKTEKRLEMKKEEYQRLRKALEKASSEGDRADILKRLESVEKEKKEAEQEERTLADNENDLKELLRAHTAMHFAEQRELKREVDLLDEQKLAMSHKYMDWDIKGTYKNYLALRDYLIAAAEKAAITCNVTIRSERDLGETPGATIKYQTPTQRQFARGLSNATTAKCPTTCSEEMKPNTYYIWTERNNKPSSDPEQRFVITSENVSVRLQESPQQ